MIVDARVLHWTAMGMREAGGIGDYIEVREAERLLEQAHARGVQAGLEKAAQAAPERR